MRGILAIIFITWPLTSLAQIFYMSPHYKIEVYLKPKLRTIEGIQTLTFQNPKDKSLSEVYLVLYGNVLKRPNPHIHPLFQEKGYPSGFDPGWTRVLSVKDKNGTKLKFFYEKFPQIYINYSLDEVLCRVELASPIPPKGSCTLVVEFETKFPERYSFGDMSCFKDTYIWRFAWHPVLRLYESGGWSNKWTIEAGDYQIRLHLPREFLVAEVADIQHEEIRGDK